MANYTIKQLEEISGIKAHTIRIWEKRYGLFSPARTNTNIRTYCERDLKKLLNISILRHTGYKISKIATLSEEEIYDKILYSSSLSEDYEVQIKNLLIATIGFDEHKFEKVLSKCIMQLGFEDTFISILYPLFHHIGLLWQTCKINPAQEHFVTQLVRQKLIAAIDGIINNESPNTLKFLMFLPENEYHELCLLFYYYLLKRHHHKVIYLGQSVPINDVIEVVNNNDIDSIFTSVTTCNEKDKLQAYVHELATLFPSRNVILSGKAFTNIDKTFPNVKKIIHPSMIHEVLMQLSPSGFIHNSV